ncbi:ABC transporter substrate-binding protein [Propionibacterium freudenreichii]|uniref:ABC transporter substrate-binding protein n=1 Tax=Propionibacterium freudenreichii TaxID=1744 RepID=UPI00054270FA|nr:ABC transporter substrate-binding protein [Propionibacterium freudenreichii]CEG85577.1 Periplasmic binding protein [Propionibacterium freudenreichii]CEI24343.1 Periplasmic binding protein [Propionibacterium freudenreichii]SBN52962.1 Putative Fe uptake ABC transporter solute-binding protein [Propionibacterium freudenreichii]
MNARTDHTSTRTRRMLCLAAAALTLVSAACGQAVSESSPSSSSAQRFTDESCGVSTDYSAAPQRAVTLTSNATETMLELGLQDKMVGTAYMRGRDIAPQYSEAYSKVPILSAEQPTMEQLLAASPDFVYAGYPDGFSEKTGHTRDQLRQKGIKTHLTPEACATSPVGVDSIYTELTTLGAIFGVRDRAQESVNALKQRVDAVKQRVGKDKPVSIFLYASGTDKALTAGGDSMANALIEAAGGTNIFADVNQRWPSVSWEQVSQRNPDIILIREEGTTPQYQSPSVTQKKQTLEGISAIASTTAMTQGRFATVTLSQLQPGPYSVDGIEYMAKQFHPEASS